MRLAKFFTLLAAAFAFTALPALAQVNLNLGGVTNTQSQSQAGIGGANLGMGSGSALGGNVGASRRQPMGVDLGSAMDSTFSAQEEMNSARAAQQASVQA